MNEEELIELIQGCLPEELTAEQIAQLREAMRTSPRLRDALLEELSLEQGLATKYAPTLEHIEEMVSRIAEQAATRKRLRWLAVGSSVVLALAVVVVGVLLAARFFGEPAARPGPVVAGRPAPSPRGTTQPTQPADLDANGAVASVSPPPGRDANRPGEPTTREAVGEPPETAPATQPKLLAPWRLFDASPVLETRALREAFGALFQKASGRNEIHLDNRHLRLRGSFRLLGGLREGQLLRLALYDVSDLSLEAWHGEEGARIVFGTDPFLRGARLTRESGAPVPQRVACDQRCPYLRRTPIDFRYQDGHLLAACGDVVLLAVPLPGPPTEVYLRTQSRLMACRRLPCRPLKLPARDGGKVVLDSRRPSGLTWSTDKLFTAELYRHPDGSVELTGKDLKADVSTTTQLATAPGKEISLRLADLALGGGFFAHIQGNRRHLRYYVVRDRDSDALVLVANPGDKRLAQVAIRDGLVVGKAFWVRFRVGLDKIDTAISNDGDHWARLQEIRLESGSPVGEGISFALFLPRRGGRHRAKVTAIRIRRFDALPALAAADLVRRVPDSKLIRDAKALETVWPVLVGAKPKDIPAWTWRLACDAALLRRSSYAPIRRAAAWDLLETAAAHLPDTDAVLRAVEQFAAQTSAESDQAREKSLRDFYDHLAERCFADGQRAKLTAVLDSWLQHTLGAIGWRGDNQSLVPASLARLTMYHLLQSQRWDDLAYQSARLLFLHRTTTQGLAPYLNSSASPVRLLQWMAAEARGVVGDSTDEAATVWQGSWGHPLSLQTDRETMNVISEFVASINAKAYEHAAKTLASQTLPDGIVPTNSDAQLYRAIHYHIRRLIDTHPELARLLRERFAPLAGVRLQRALLAGDVQTLQTLVVYFHGTAPARRALHRLADRELSMGNGAAAAAKYRSLLEGETDPAAKHEIAAKYRLASALAGQLAGQPIRKPVELPGKRISAAEFEAMIASLVKTRPGGAGEMAVPRDRPAASATGTPAFTEVCTLTADRDDPTRPFTRQVLWAVHGRNLIIHQKGRLTAVNLDGRNVVWSHQESLKGSPSRAGGATWPIVSGNRLFARLHSRRGAALVCIDLRSGKPLWQERLDDGILSNPILVNSWLYVLTHRSMRGGTSEIYLRRVSPETGRSSLAARLLALRRRSGSLGSACLALAQDRLLFRCAATVACCDLLGQVQWIRRLTFVPPDVDRGLSEDLVPSGLIVRDQHVLLIARACPSLECLDIRTGSRVWSYLQPKVRRLVGVVGNSVVLATEGHIEGVDATTGKGLWRVAGTAHPSAILPAEKNALLSVTLDRVDPNKKDKRQRGLRRVRWLSATDGREIRSVAVTDPALAQKLYEATALYAVGREVVGLASYRRDQRTATVFRMQLR